MPSRPPANCYALAVVILGAGRSTRMGRPKLLLPWKNNSVLGHLITQWKGLAPAQIAVVMAQGDASLNAELDRLEFSARDRIENASPESGMFSSVQCAAKWTGWDSSVTHWAIVLGDQPHLTKETLLAVLALGRQEPDRICQPTFRGHRRHPVILPRSVFFKSGSSNAQTLKEFLQDGPAAYCALEDPRLGLDLDSPEDYATALRLYSAG